MTNTKYLVKGLIGATALTVFTVGTAHAGGTQAGTPVSNTFTLDYEVNGTTQPTIDTGVAGTNTPTLFTVDRLVDLTVADNGPTPTTPGATDQQLVYSVTNNGNDSQDYALSIFEETTDDFQTSDPATLEVIRYYIDDGDGVYEPNGTGDGALIDYNPATPPNLGIDDVLWVVVTQDIPGTAADGEQADIILIADTLDPVSHVAVDADNDGNSLTGAAENVLADESGTGQEGIGAGDHSALNSYTISSADINAVKTVDVHTEDGSNCTTFPGTATGGYAIPGSCVEYVITVTNEGSEAATAIDIVDDIAVSGNLQFEAVTSTGFTAGTFTGTPANGADCGTGTGQVACTISFTGGTLPAPTGGSSETVGTIVIRAIVK